MTLADPADHDAAVRPPAAVADKPSWLRRWKKWFADDVCPVGIDLGSETMRMAQVRQTEYGPALVAAACRFVPPGLTDDWEGYLSWLTDAVRETWREGGFAGRAVRVAVPESLCHVLHVRPPRGDPSLLAQSVRLECVGRLPFDPSAAVLRHQVVGEVFANDGPRLEVVVTAARRDRVEGVIAAFEKARLEVRGITEAASAAREVFGRLWHRAADAQTCLMFVDLGASSTRVAVEKAGHLYFARVLDVAGADLDRAVAAAVGVPVEEAKVLRARSAEASTSREAVCPPPPAEKPHESAEGFALLGAAMRSAGTAPVPAGPAVDPVESATHAVVTRLGDELERCRRYHEATFPGVPVGRVVFVGGEANGRALCQKLAQRLHLPAQVGDPVSRLTPHAGFDAVAAGIDRRRPQPGWAAACGLSMGSD